MKTISYLPAAILAASLVVSAQAQEFREIPVEPDPPEQPLSMERLFQEERAKGNQEPATPDPGDVLAPETESERIQRTMMNRMRREMMVQDEEQREETGADRPRWMIGISVEPVEPFLREHLGIEEGSGARVSLVAKDSPAERAGIAANDIILAANGDKIATIEQLKAKVEKSGKEGKPLALEILHRGQRKSISLQPRGPKPEDNPEEGGPPRRPDADQRVANFARRLARQERQIAELREEVAKLKARIEEADDDR